jgi:uncharacterized membrane protein
MQYFRVRMLTMQSDDPRSTARIGAHPIHPMLVPFPIACFVGTFVTDLAYWQTTDVMWETLSAWLLTAGLITAGFAVIAGLIDFRQQAHSHASAGLASRRRHPIDPQRLRA